MINCNKSKITLEAFIEEMHKAVSEAELKLSEDDENTLSITGAKATLTVYIGKDLSLDFSKEKTNFELELQIK